MNFAKSFWKYALVLGLLAIVWRIVTPYENVYGVRTRALCWLSPDSFVIQLGDWVSCFSPGLVVVNVADTPNTAYELTGNGMEQFSKMQGVAVAIDDLNNQLAIVCMDSERNLKLGLGKIQRHDESDRVIVNINKTFALRRVGEGLTHFHDRPLSGLSFCDSGRLLIVGYDRQDSAIVNVVEGTICDSVDGLEGVTASRDGLSVVGVTSVGRDPEWCKVARSPANATRTCPFLFQPDVVNVEPELGGPNSMTCVAISADGEQYVCGYYERVLLYVDRRRRIQSPQLTSHASATVISSNLKCILFATHDMKIGKWNYTTQEVTWIDDCTRILQNNISRMRLSSDERYLILTDDEARSVVVYEKDGNSFRRFRVIPMERSDFRKLRSQFRYRSEG